MILLGVIPLTSAFSKEDVSLIEATQVIREYAITTVKPILDSSVRKDKLSLLPKVADIITDAKIDLQINAIKPNTYIIYDKLDKIRLGIIMTFRLSSEQKLILKAWPSKFMRKNPADVFFAPSADDIVKTKAAFGCSHYARSFISIVKALSLVEKPEDLLYVISTKADNYNQALKIKNTEMIINGHQCATVKIDSKWIAINTSKSEWIEMPDGFSPDSINTPVNIPIRFASYPEVTFLLRKIGKDINDDCNDNSLVALMNIYRSGDSNNTNFMWERFVGTDNASTQRMQ